MWKPAARQRRRLLADPPFPTAARTTRGGANPSHNGARRLPLHVPGRGGLRGWPSIHRTTAPIRRGIRSATRGRPVDPLPQAWCRLPRTDANLPSAAYLPRPLGSSVVAVHATQRDPGRRGDVPKAMKMVSPAEEWSPPTRPVPALGGPSTTASPPPPPRDGPLRRRGRNKRDSAASRASTTTATAQPTTTSTPMTAPLNRKTATRNDACQPSGQHGHRAARPRTGGSSGENPGSMRGPGERVGRVPAPPSTTGRSPSSHWRIEPKGRPSAVGALWDFSGTSGPINRHERETAERSFAQVSDHQSLIAAGHRVHWSLPGQVIIRHQQLRAERRPPSAPHRYAPPDRA
ncbi:hypothetical protein SO3561_09642 [Streptomyces olivochromogenes]|uniref:Uncharacterized protein n=1 Tax=Streptomyces olivochromogenes TaxID=1963 RepID=A0A250VVB3_STROL|nr:hypothetical protein SO3561_09642 [Streptomyces olivochromogenes]